MICVLAIHQPLTASQYCLQHRRHYGHLPTWSALKQRGDQVLGWWLPRLLRASPPRILSMWRDGSSITKERRCWHACASTRTDRAAARHPLRRRRHHYGCSARSRAVSAAGIIQAGQDTGRAGLVRSKKPDELESASGKGSRGFRQEARKTRKRCRAVKPSSRGASRTCSDFRLRFADVESRIPVCRSPPRPPRRLPSRLLRLLDPLSRLAAPARPGAGPRSRRLLRGMAFEARARNRQPRRWTMCRRRELVYSVYRESLLPLTLLGSSNGVAATEVHALAYIAEHAHPAYAGRMALARQVELIRGACGRAELTSTTSSTRWPILAGFGIEEPRLARILTIASPFVARGLVSENHRPRSVALTRSWAQKPVERPYTVRDKRFGHRAKLTGALHTNETD